MSGCFSEAQPEYVFLTAAKAGGILANSSFAADFIYDNMAIQTNVIHQDQLHGVKTLLLPGSVLNTTKSYLCAM
jgi:GDP-L-fucose synthase